MAKKSAKKVLKKNVVQEEIAELVGSDIDFKFEKGKALISFGHEGKDAGIQITVSVNADSLLDKLAAAIPGQIDDTVIALLKGALKSIKA